MEHAALQVDRRDHVAWVTLNRPDALNAMNRALVRELRAFFSSLGEDPETRVVVLRGAGRAFCAGLDLKEAQRPATAATMAPCRRDCARSDRSASWSS